MSLRYALALAMVLGCSLDLLAACSGAGNPPKAPCATDIVAEYTAKMIAAGCTGEHFNDAKCEPIKAERNAREKDAGCLQ